MAEFEGVALKDTNGRYTGIIRKATDEEKEEVRKLGIVVN